MDEREKKNRQIGALTSVGVHVVVVVILFFVVAWRAPDPPLPEYGIELNFGLDDAGSGQVQPETPAGSEGEEPDAVEADQQEKPETDPSETKADQPAAEKQVEQVVSKLESPVVVTEEKKEAKKEDPNAVYKPANSTPTESTKEVAKVTKADATKTGDPASHGDDKAKTGDKGSKEGKIDAKALYGTPGGGGGGTGMNLQMSGWAWAEQPALPELPDNENGRVEFEIECDENGDITGITTLVRSLSPKAEQLLKDVIRKNSLVRTSGGKVPERSKGRIVFVLRTN